MADVTLTRWTRYGHDRLYVRNADGAQVGWVDLRTSSIRREDGTDWPPEADELISAWCAEHGITSPVVIVPAPTEPQSAAEPAPEPATPPPPPPPSAPAPASSVPSPQQAPADEPATPAASAAIASATEDTSPATGRGRRPWTDLAKNRPGAAVKAAAKERTTWWSRILRSFGIQTADAPWRVGYKGERKAARTLWLMRPFGWRVLHSVPVGDRGADIDHVLIGPGGVVTVNTKHHRRGKITAGHTKVLVNGRPTDYAAKSTFEADRATRLLTAAAGHPVDVQAIIVIIGARNVRNGHTAGIDVITRIELPIWLLTHRGRLDRQQRRDLYEIARRSTTWQGL